MVSRTWLLFWFFCVSIFPRNCVAQIESGQSMIQALCANAESIRNYDVSFRHWVGYLPRDQKSKDENVSDEESVTIGRVVVDRSQERILYVREFSMEVDGTKKKETIFVEWRKGIETSMTDQNPFPVTEARTFDRFYKLRSVPVVERCLGRFPPVLINKTIEEDIEQVVQRFEASTLKMHPDGSSTVTLKINDSNYKYSANFDPISSMPTKCSVSEYDSKSGAFLRVVDSDNPRYEKCKEIYRIISLEYNEPTSIGLNMPRHAIGTAQFDWHQFNEEVIRFPNDDGATFGFEEAQKFLRFNGSSKVK